MKLRFATALAWLLFIIPAAESMAADTAMTVATQHVNVGKDKIAYRSLGSGTPILLLNRMRGTLDTWDPLFLDSLAKGNRVITVDYPGIGYSTGKLPPDMGKAADFVDQFATAVGLTQFVIAGWSWGGFTSQTYMVDHPGRATHVILMGTNPPGKGQLPIQQAFIDRAFKPVNDLADEEVLFFDPTSAASRAAAKASHDRIFKRPGVIEKIPSTMEEIKSFIDAHAVFRDDEGGRLRKMMASRTPILIISGDKDISNPVENWFALNAKLPNAHHIVYPQSGHGPQHQYPELAAQQIHDFLQRAVK